MSKIDSPQSLGGKARAALLSPEKRSEIARQSARARWSLALPRALYGSADQPLKIGDIEIDCYVLDNGIRVISQRAMFKGLGFSRGGARENSENEEDGAELPRFATQNWLNPFINIDLDMALRNPILFATGSGRAYGYPATILPDICDAILAARAANATTPRQESIIQRCELLVRGFARVGIIALVDEATGYQKVRARDELQKILSAYISPELLPWAKRFPDNFYEHLHRVRGWEYKPNSNARTAYIGKLTNFLIYEQLPKGILQELRQRNPRNPVTKRRRHAHHQMLTDDIGHPHLERQIIAVTTLLSVSDDWAEFARLFTKKFPPGPDDLFSSPPA
jgi:P63C domain